MKLEIRPEGVAIARLEAGKANAIDHSFIDRLDGLLDELQRTEARALVVTGYDRYFSAGLSLPTLIDLDRAQMSEFIERFDNAMLRLFECPLPTVAAINGHAIAGGCVIALQADYRMMADGPSQIGLSEAQLGISLPPIVIETLRSQLPPASLIPIAYEGRLLAPSVAVLLGLVHEVVPQAELEARAMLRAAQLASGKGQAFAAIKHALRQPAVEAVRRNGDGVARWLDCWFSDAGRAAVAEAVDKLSNR
jgi:enoyl-CoA hydratase